ncbi:hypothetical protein AXG89_32005 (plasmid) [Burkholderia sp. PAMC 26561]|nr:hypothetical protein AXG89_32005 [Burkholderia sp. PAMC 26561]
MTYAATALGLSTLAVSDLDCELDVRYGSLKENRLDIFYPPKPSSDCPVFIAIHGGNWSHGYKEWMGFGAIPLVAAGVIFVAIDYRLSTVSRFPSQLEDCLDALSWVHRNISRYGGSPDRIFVGGHSAGAHLAALATLRTDLHKNHSLGANVIKGCFPFSGIYDLRRDDKYGITPSIAVIEEFLSSIDDAVEASPICHVAGNRVPFFVSWAENDAPLMRQQGAPFVSAVEASGSHVKCHVFPAFDHFHIHLDQVRPENLHNRVLIEWMSDPRP